MWWPRQLYFPEDVVCVIMLNSIGMWVLRLSNEKENKNLVKKMLTAVKTYVFHIQGTFMGNIRTKVHGKIQVSIAEPYLEI